MNNETTALIIPQGSSLADLFKAHGGVDPIIERIKEQVAMHHPDVTTAKGRKEIASLAYKVSQSKTALDDAGKKLAEDAKREVALIDAARKKIRDACDAIRDQARKPLTEWEAAEDARVNAAKDTINAVRNHGMTGEETSAEIAETAARIKAIIANPEYDEYLHQIEGAREMTLTALRSMYAAAKKREDQEAELEQLRREKAEREAKEAADRDAREATERVAARIEEEKRQQEVAAKLEKERQEQLQREKEQAAKEAADAERKAAAEREADLKRQIEHAAQAERDRIDAERKAEADARAKREADASHRARIVSEIAAALEAYEAAGSMAMADAIVGGAIPHVRAAL